MKLKNDVMSEVKNIITEGVKNGDRAEGTLLFTADEVEKLIRAIAAFQRWSSLEAIDSELDPDNITMSAIFDIIKESDESNKLIYD